jgi:recombinational DNA repair protein (RecF pathway)
MDAKQKCAACDKVKQETEFKQKRDGFNAVCKQCSENRKAARDRKKADSELEGTNKNTVTPTVTEDENEEEEHLRKEMNNLTLEQFINALMATEDVRSLTAFVDLTTLEGGNEREKADRLAEAIWEQLKYRFV